MLVYTSNEGSPGSQVELSTPSQNVARGTLQEASSVLTYPPPGGGLLRVQVGGGVPDQILGTDNGQFLYWDANAGQWVLSDPPTNTAVPVWSSTLNTWVMTPRPAAVRSIGYTAAAPLVLQLMPASHQAGNYLISLLGVVRTAALTGTIGRSYQFSTPVFGATQIAGFGTASVTALGAIPASFTTLAVYSDGANPITVTLTPAGITGAPIIDVTAQAVLVGS